MTAGEPIVLKNKNDRGWGKVLQRSRSVSGLGPGKGPFVPKGKENYRRDGSFDYYMSEPIRDNDPKGIGPFIWASLEMEQYNAQ